jgi:DNA-nicking Smr family endonuclease
MSEKDISKVTNTEHDLFQAEMKDVRRLQVDKIEAYRNLKKIRPFKDNTIYKNQDMADPLSDEWETKHVKGEEFIFYSQSGLQYKTQKQLRQGRIPVDDHLDLHGMTIREAREELLQFINFAQQRHCHCIRLVHGKGYRAENRLPILKNKINNWLRQHPDVIAFSSAQPRDGGAGAVYILIKTI